MPPERATTLVRDGLSAARAGDNVRARTAFREAVALNPNLVTAWIWLAGLSADPAEAIGHLQQVLRLNPKHERAKTWLEHQRARLPRWYCPICQAQASERFTTCPSCRAALDLSRPDAALTGDTLDVARVRAGADRLAGVVQQQPDFFPHYYLGMALLNLGQPEEALEQFRAAGSFRPADAGFAAQVAGLEQALMAAVPPQPPVPTQLAPRAAPTAGPRSVMVVDDSPTIRKLIRLTMTKNGFRVVEAGDGEEALEQIRIDGVPDLVLVDVVMPGMDGYTLCKRIRQNPATARVPVIILSARDGTLDKVRGKMAGSERYLTKPFEPAALVRAVREFCPQGGRING